MKNNSVNEPTCAAKWCAEPARGCEYCEEHHMTLCGQLHHRLPQVNETQPSSNSSSDESSEALTVKLDADRCVKCGHDEVGPDGLCWKSYAVRPSPNAVWKDTHCGCRCEFTHPAPSGPLNEAGERWDDDYGQDPKAALLTSDAERVRDVLAAWGYFMHGDPEAKELEQMILSLITSIRAEYEQQAEEAAQRAAERLNDAGYFDADMIERVAAIITAELQVTETKP